MTKLPPNVRPFLSMVSPNESLDSLAQATETVMRNLNMFETSQVPLNASAAIFSPPDTPNIQPPTSMESMHRDILELKQAFESCQLGHSVAHIQQGPGRFPRYDNNDSYGYGPPPQRFARGRSYDRSAQNCRSLSRSRNSNSNLCWYHAKLGDQARKCASRFCPRYAEMTPGNANRDAQ